MAAYLILVVDDDPTEHLILGNYLKLSGYEVVHADSGEHALKIMEVQKPDLILLDISMPGMDGFQVIKRIRENSGFAEIPVFFLSSLDRQHLKIKGFEQGADDYITKPFDQGELLARIKAALRRVARRHRTEGVMAGDLSDIGLADILQSLELGQKTAWIRLKDMDGEIAIQHGELLFCRQDRFTGSEAMLRLFLLERGPFSVRFNELPDGVTGTLEPLTGVLMETLAEVDEVRDIIRRIKAGNRIVGIGDDLSGFPTIEKSRTSFPASFLDLVVAMAQTPKDNLKTLIQAYKKGKLKLLN